MLIDWSDPEEMYSLLIEYVQDERALNRDSGRGAFLDRLLQELNGVSGDASLAQRMEALNEIVETERSEFDSDEVLQHVRDCLDELERIARA